MSHTGLHARRNSSTDTVTRMTRLIKAWYESTGKMELTTAQLEFLCSLRQASVAAAYNVDASVVGPLIRANLVRWEDDAGAAARRSLTPRSTFTLTLQGVQLLVDRGIASAGK